MSPKLQMAIIRIAEEHTLCEWRNESPVWAYDKLDQLCFTLTLDEALSARHLFAKKCEQLQNVKPFVMANI
jgi:hypothetical protein